VSTGGRRGGGRRGGREANAWSFSAIRANREYATILLRSTVLFFAFKRVLSAKLPIFYTKFIPVWARFVFAVAETICVIPRSFEAILFRITDSIDNKTSLEQLHSIVSIDSNICISEVGSKSEKRFEFVGSSTYVKEAPFSEFSVIEPKFFTIRTLAIVSRPNAVQREIWNVAGSE
jgi:hypothetical protein